MKKKFLKCLLSVLLVMAIISSMFSISAIAMDITVLESANLICGANENINMPSYDEVEEWYGQQPTLSLNPEYIKYLQDAEQGDVSAYDGVIPSATPVIDSEFNDNTRNLRTILPTKYNSQEQGYVTSVKNQEPRGICWSYAAVSALESFLLKEHNITRDYSENYYNYFFAQNAYSDISLNPYAPIIKEDGEWLRRHLDKGGYARTVFGAMVSGIGPVLQNEFDDNITDSILSQRMDITRDTLLLGYDTIGQLDVHAGYSKYYNKIIKIKEAILNNGSVTFSYHAPEDGEDRSDVEKYYSFENYAYYIDTSNPKNYKNNHAVALVGWDDDYPKENFSSENQPISDGAFIIKNSWGAEKGDKGYYYISYEDYFIYQSELLSPTAAVLGNKYSTVYSLAYNNIGLFIEQEGNSFTMANMFVNQGRSDEYIEAVGFSTLYANTSYEISVGLCGDTFGVKDVIKLAEGTTTSKGYHTITLDSSFYVEKDSNFVVVVALEVPGIEKIYVTNVECNGNGVSKYAYNFTGGTAWLSPNCNVSPYDGMSLAYDINAYMTTFPSATVVATGINIRENNNIIVQGDSCGLHAAVYPSTANQAVNWSSSNTSVATVDSSGVVTGVGSGVAVITARSVDGGYTDTCTITVDDYGGDFYNAAEVTLEEGLLKMLPMSFEYSGDIDVFKFKAPAAGRYAIYSTGAEFNVYLTVDNSSYSCIGYSYKTDGSNKAECTVDLAAGEYYYLVLNPADDNSIGGYTLNIAPASGAMDKRYVDISVGGETVITASENYASDFPVVFSSSDPAVATVDASGKITGISGGTATVTAKSADGLYSASCTVRVDEYGNDFDYAFEWGNVSYTSINSKTGGVQYGNDRDFFKFSVPVNGNYIVYFTDKNSEVKARLYYKYNDEYNTPSNGLINNPNGNGSMGAFLTTDHEYYLEVFSADNSVCDYEVNIMLCTPVSSVTLNTDAVQLMVGGRYSLIATVFPENAYNKSVKWTTTNSDVVTVSDGGVITGVGSGSALVMVTTEDKGMSYVCEVTVNSYDDVKTALDDGTYRIQNVKSLLYMNGATSDGNTKSFKQEAYSDGNGQVWEIKNTGDGYCTIASAYNPGLYVTATGTNNTNCVLNYASLPSGGVGDAQKWKTVKNPDGTYRIISKEYKGFAIAVFAASSEPHENMVMFEDNQTRNAKWLIIAEERHTLPDGVYTFANVKSGHALDIHGVTPESGLGVMQNICSETSSKQRWTIQYVSNGYYTIASCADNSLYLKAVSDSEVKLASATQLSASADDSMLWAVLKNSDGSYRISPKAYPNKAAVVIGALTISGADVILFDDNMTRNGWWRLKCEAIDSAELMQIESGSYYLQNEYSGKYMFMGGSLYNDVVQTGNHDNFPWSISCDNDGCFTISINYKLLRYVAAEGEEAYVDVVLNTTGQHDNIEEKWFMDRDGRIHSAKYPNKVLAIENDSKDGGAYVVLADIETHQSERWMVLKAN